MLVHICLMHVRFSWLLYSLFDCMNMI